MQELLLFLLLGLGTGAVTAGIGVSLVVLYKGTGVINFGQGAIAAWAAYVSYQLESTGDLVLPVVFIPDRLHIADTVPAAVAVSLGLLSAVGLGAAMHALIFRPLRRAPELARIVASVGVLLTVEALIVLHFGTDTKIPAPLLPSDPVSVLGASVTEDRLLLAAAAVLVGLVLWSFFRFTSIGLAIRASAESEKGVVLGGRSPERLALVSWMLSALVAGIFGVLIAPVIGLSPQNFSLLVIPALAVAVVGRFTGLAVTTAAGLALGMAQAGVQYFAILPWFPLWAHTGVPETLPFFLATVALFLAGKSLPTRASLSTARLPRVPIAHHPYRTAAIFVPFAAAALVVLHGGYRLGLVTGFVTAILLLSIVVLTGYVGLISLAQAAFAGLGGFGLSLLAQRASVPFPLSAIIPILFATVLGTIIGIPALRIRGSQLAVVTMAGAVGVQQFVFANPALRGPSTTFPVPNPQLFGIDIGAIGPDYPRLAFGFFALAVLAMTCLAVANLRRSGTGRRFLAVRANERAAASIGIDVAATKLLAFAIASFLAALAGVMLSYLRGQVSPDAFGVFLGLTFLAVAYLGGMTTISGAILGGLVVNGGLVYTLINRNVNLGDYYLLLSGLSLILTVLFNPDGMSIAMGGGLTRLRRLAKIRFQKARPVGVG